MLSDFSSVLEWKIRTINEFIEYENITSQALDRMYNNRVK